MLFGGVLGNAAIGETWEWDGTTWTPRAMSNPGPGPRIGVGTGSRSDGVLIVGGNGQGMTFDDAWLLRGTQWQLWSPPSSGLPALYPAQVGYDLQHDELVAFGGVTPWRGHVVFTSGIWVHGIPRAAEVPYGGSCASSGVWPELSGVGLPVLGNAAYALQARGLAAAQPVVFVLGNAMAPFELPRGCRVFVTPVTAIPATVSSSGVVTLPAPVPALPGLVGAELHVQAAALDPTRAGLVVTPALLLRLGR